MYASLGITETGQCALNVTTLAKSVREEVVTTAQLAAVLLCWIRMFVSAHLDNIKVEFQLAHPAIQVAMGAMDQETLTVTFVTLMMVMNWKDQIVYAKAIYTVQAFVIPAIQGVTAAQALETPTAILASSEETPPMGVNATPKSTMTEVLVLTAIAIVQSAQGQAMPSA